MEYEKVREMGKLFDKYLTYKGFNLWKMDDVGIYAFFLKDPRKRTKIEKIKDILQRFLVKIIDFKREKEKKLRYFRGNVLMLATGVNPVRTFYPIYKKIKEIKIIRYDLPSVNTAQNALKEKGMDYNNLDAYMNSEIRQNVRRAESWLKNAFEKIKKDEVLRKKLAKNYDYVIDALECLCKTRMRFLEIIKIIELFYRIYKIENIKILIVAEEGRAGKVAISVARKMKIPSLFLQHGIILGDLNSGKFESDRMAVHGIREKQFLISRKADAKKIIITGQPRFDVYKEMLKISREDACKNFDLDPKKKIIVFAAQPHQPGEIVSYKASEEFGKLMDKFKDDKNYEFVIKMHPEMGDFGEKTYFPNLDSKVKVLRDVDLGLLLRACDVLINIISTVGVEAVLLDRPVIAIEIGWANKVIDYGEEKVGFTIKKENMLESALYEVLNNPKFKRQFEQGRKKFIKNFVYKLDGKSADRVINLVEKMKRFK